MSCSKPETIGFRSNLGFFSKNRITGIPAFMYDSVRFFDGCTKEMLS